MLRLSFIPIIIFQFMNATSDILYIIYIMSIYSGFATRKDEQIYNKLLTKLITTMQKHIIQLLLQLNTKIIQQKANEYARIIFKMRNYEQHKYLPPKFTQILQPLQQHFINKQKTYSCKLNSQKITPSCKFSDFSQSKVKICNFIQSATNKRSKSIISMDKTTYVGKVKQKNIQHFEQEQNIAPISQYGKTKQSFFVYNLKNNNHSNNKEIASQSQIPNIFNENKKMISKFHYRKKQILKNRKLRTQE